MSFLQSKSEQLANYLRGLIQRNEVREPLPGTRDWSRSLGVARVTLTSALQILQREGVVKIHARGYRLTDPIRPKGSRSKRAPRLVRMLFYASDYPDLSGVLGLIFPLSELLQKQGISFQAEKCSDARLQAIARQTEPSPPLSLLASLAPRHQALFAQCKKPSVIIGSPAPGINLPFITLDQAGGVSHATNLLLRQGFKKVALLISRASGPGAKESIKAFQSACAQWPHQPVTAQTVLMPSDESERRSLARRFAARIVERCGILVVGPVPVSLVLTALLERGIAMPSQAEVVAIFPPFQMTSFCPPIRYYAMPNDTCIKELVNVAVHYFECGLVPDLHRRVPLEIAPLGE